MDGANICVHECHWRRGAARALDCQSSSPLQSPQCAWLARSCDVVSGERLGMSRRLTRSTTNSGPAHLSRAAAARRRGAGAAGGRRGLAVHALASAGAAGAVSAHPETADRRSTRRTARPQQEEPVMFGLHPDLASLTTKDKPSSSVFDLPRFFLRRRRTRRVQ